MYLTATGVFHYLAERGVVGRRAAIDGDISIIELDRRNRGFVLLRRHGLSLYLKQIKIIDDTNVECLRREAAFYRAVHADPRFSPIADLMPSFVDFDPHRHVVIVQYLPDSENLHQYQRRFAEFPFDAARLAGQTLARQHSDVGRECARTIDRHVFQRKPPWILAFHKQKEVGYDGANLQLLRMIRADDRWQSQMVELHESWRCSDLVHNDFKWNNIVVFAGEHGRIDARVIDWELADCGDALWDAGTMLQCFWSYLVLGTPMDRPLNVDEFAQAADAAIRAFRPPAREFWTAYATGRGFDEPTAASNLLNSVRYAGARMVQTAYEYTRDEPALTDAALTLLNVSRHALDEPRQAIELFMGIPARRA